jgi:hypothetical protein
MAGIVNVDTLAPIPEIVRCWEKVDAVLPPADPTVPGDPSTNLATLAAIADAKWRRAEAAEADRDDVVAAYGKAMEENRGLACRVAELEAALREIAGYEHPLGMSTRDSLDAVQQIARWSLPFLLTGDGGGAPDRDLEREPSDGFAGSGGGA